MLKSNIFETTLVNSHSFIVPEEVIELFKEHNQKRAKVTISFNSKSLTFYGAINPRKNGLHWMYLSKEKQKELGIFINDYFKVQLFEDQSKYGVEMPEELEAVLTSDPEAFSIFDSFTPGKKRSLIYTIKRYKTSQTKIDKAILLTTNLKRGITDPKMWLKSNF